MINLILKDFLVQKKMFLIILLYIVFFMLIMGSGGFVAAGTAAAYILLLNALAYDDKNKSDIVLNSIPLARNNIVKARYLSVFIFAGFGIIAYWVISLLIKLLHLPLIIAPVSLGGIGGILLSVILLASLYLPLNFKYGYIKARVFHVILFLAVFWIPGFLAKYLQEIDPGLLSYLSNRTDWLIMLSILGLVLLIVGFSYGISWRIYRNKEF